MAVVGERIPEKLILGIGSFTLLLTAAFIGVSGFIAGGNPGIGDRIPFYVLVVGITFVVVMLVLDDRDHQGAYVFVAVVGVTAMISLLVAVAIEGGLYAIRNPGEVVASKLLIYFIAAGLVCTGIGIWGVRHWREFTR